MYVFGYGSLVNIEKLKEYLGRDQMFKTDELFICKLKGYRRVWNVAMNNSVDLPGYKHYVEAKDDGTYYRPDCFVTFLNVETYEGTDIIGVLFKVDEDKLKQLRLRERNYELIDVTQSLDIEIEGRAYTFIASDSGRKRFELGKENNLAVISIDYLKFVENAYLDLQKNRLKYECYFSHNYLENIVESFKGSTYLSDSIRFKKLEKLLTS